MPRRKTCTTLARKSTFRSYRAVPLRPKDTIILKSKIATTKWSQELIYPFVNRSLRYPSDLYLLSQLASIKQEIDANMIIYFNIHKIVFTDKAEEILYNIYYICQYPYMYDLSFYSFLIHLQKIVKNLSQGQLILPPGMAFNSQYQVHILDSTVVWEIFKNMYFYPSLTHSY
jgi:hypothetical protein